MYTKTSIYADAVQIGFNVENCRLPLHKLPLKELKYYSEKLLLRI